MVEEQFSFADEDPGSPTREDDARLTWKVLIVDDEPAVHSVTRLALGDIEVAGRGVTLLHAYSGAEAMEQFREHDDIALCLLDVIMETEKAGLEVARGVRDELKNKLTRIVLRTGHAADVPEREVICAYDIQGFAQKSELTATRLFTITYTAIGAYRDMLALSKTRDALVKMMQVMHQLSDLRSLKEYTQALLEQMCAVVDLEAVIYLGWDWQGEARPKVLATSGVPTASSVTDLIRQSIGSGHKPVQKLEGGELLMVQPVGDGEVSLGMVARCGHDLDEAEMELISMFCDSLSIATAKNFDGSFR